MRLLLDTNVLIWWLRDDAKLGPQARQMIADRSSEILVSVISLWEVTMKWRVGKMNHAGSAFLDDLTAQGIVPLGISAPHLLALEALGFEHRDPFDHLILAQALVEGARVMTSDQDMTLYGVRCVPANR